MMQPILPLSDLLASSRGVLHRGGVGAGAMPNWARGFPQQPSQHSPLPWVSTIYYSGLELLYILWGYMELAYILWRYSRQQLPRWGRHPASAFWHFPPNFPPDFRRMSCRTSSPELAARAPQRRSNLIQQKRERKINTITDASNKMWESLSAGYHWSEKCSCKSLWVKNTSFHVHGGDETGAFIDYSQSIWPPFIV